MLEIGKSKILSISSVNAIDIKINGTPYDSVTSPITVDIPVINSAISPVGTIVGTDVVIGNSPITITDSASTPLYTINVPAEALLNQAINDSTLNVNKSDGTLISARSILAEGTDSYNVADSTAILKDEDGNTLSSTPIKATESTNITAPNGDVSVNNVAFDDVLSGGTLNIQVRKSTGNDLIGSKQGQYWRIGNSTITNSDSTYDVDVKATENLTLPDSQINVNSVDSGDVVSVKTIDVNIVDSVSAPVIPTSVGLVGNTLTIEVPSGASPSGVEFKFPIYWQRTSYRTGDVGDRVQNNWMDDLVNPINPAAVANLDYSSSNWWQTLENPLIVNGVSSTDRFVDVNGVQVFTSTDNANLVVIDKLTSLMYTRNLSNAGTWTNAIDSALTHSIVVNSVTYDDWYLASQEEFLSVFGFYRTDIGGIGGLFSPALTLLAGSGINLNFTSTTNEILTTQAVSYNFATKSTAVTLKTSSASGLIFVRKAQNLITAP
jgi:hypothetical protein